MFFALQFTCKISFKMENNVKFYLNYNKISDIYFDKSREEIYI